MNFRINFLSLESVWAVWIERLRPALQTHTRTLGQLLAPLNECLAFGLNGFKCSWVLVGAPRCSRVLMGAGGELLCVRGLLGGPGTLGVLLGAPGDPYNLRRVEIGQKVQ
jgi:hypothetical protein